MVGRRYWTTNFGFNWDVIQAGSHVYVSASEIESVLFGGVARAGRSGGAFLAVLDNPGPLGGRGLGMKVQLILAGGSGDREMPNAPLAPMTRPRGSAPAPVG